MFTAQTTKVLHAQFAAKTDQVIIGLTEKFAISVKLRRKNNEKENTTHHIRSNQRA